MAEITNPLWYAWISNKRAHTCSCGHVSWVHWANGKCAHCNCACNDAKKEPPVKVTIQLEEAK